MYEAGAALRGDHGFVGKSETTRRQVAHCIVSSEAHERFLVLAVVAVGESATPCGQQGFGKPTVHEDEASVERELSLARIRIEQGSPGLGFSDRGATPLGDRAPDENAGVDVEYVSLRYPSAMKVLQVLASN